MDARERLRQYLEQRRELGESELMLDGMTVEEVLKVVGAQHLSAGLGARREGGRVGEAAAWGASTFQTKAEDAPTTAGPTGAPVGAPSSAGAAPDHGGDWRAALRAAERTTGEDAEMAARRKAAPASSATPPAPAPPEASEASSAPVAPTEPMLDVGAPMGIVVGTAARVVADPALASVTSLDDIRALVASCQKCPLYATAKNPVPGEGSPTADLMCVGEAPGQTEDETGRPFVGAAGQLLTKILAAIDLPREAVFIANVLKHRPPGNRNPMPNEVAACSPYLVKQIELVRPKVIVAFGTFAAQTLLDTPLALGKLRGSVHRYYGVPLVVTYHPAALLRNPAWKRPTWEDVQLARRILDRALAPGA